MGVDWCVGAYGKNSVNGFHGAAKLDVNRITFRKENNLITSRDEHLGFQLTLLWSWLTWSIDGNFNGLCIRCNLAWIRTNCDGEGEWFAASTSSHKPQVIEFCHLIFHDSCAVPQFATIILIISSLNCDHRPVLNIIESDDFEGTRKTFIWSPVGWECGAENWRRACGNQFAVIFLQ